MDTDSDFIIKPKNLRKANNSSSHRPLPPGQTRHVYADEEDQLPRFEEDEYTDIPSSQPEETRQPTRNTRNKSRIVQEEDTPRLVRFFTDRRVLVWLGIAGILLGGIILIVLLSYIKNGALDQTVIMNLAPKEIVESGMEVKSGVGPLGAWLGHVLFAESFGIGAFIISAYFFIVGWKLLRGKKFDFWGLTFRCALLAVTISIVVGLFTYASASETFWGGIHGHYVNKWLISMAGIPGAIFVTLLLIAALIAVYLNELLHFYNSWKERMKQRKEQRNSHIFSDEEPVKPEPVTPAGARIETTPVSPAIDEPAPQPQLNDEIKSTVEDSDSVAFEIDKPSAKPANSKTELEEPGFEIDVAVFEKGQKKGSVAEQLVAEKGEIDPRAELSRYKFPTLDMLTDHPFKATVDTEEQHANKDKIIKTLGTFGITVESIKATVGPTVTLFEIVPTDGIRTAQIKRLGDDIAMSLKAKGIRIIAPMPEKGTIGIEVPNHEPQIVSMRTLLSSKKFRESKAKLPVALGSTISNEIFVTDLASMPHALVAGATGQGKSVGLNVLITSLLYRKHPSELKFVLIDPKMVEFSVYERLKGHYLASLPGEEDAIVTDPSKVLNVLNSLCIEMDTRYALLKKAFVNKIEDYNMKWCQRRLSADKGHHYMPYIVVIIDEFADLIMTGGKDIELPVMRITQKARAVGIHMIIATQRPSTNVLTGLIKANCPSRIAFRVNQMIDSRTILDNPGAEKLIGRGDMLYSQGGDMERMQCAFISSNEIESICDYIDAQPGYEQPYPLPEPVADNGAFSGSLPGGGMDRDPLFDEAARFVVMSSTASTSSLQRRFEIGYNRAGKIMDQMEAAGMVGPASGSKPRSVLIDADTLERILANR